MAWDLAFTHGPDWCASGRASARVLECRMKRRNKLAVAAFMAATQSDRANQTQKKMLADIVLRWGSSPRSMTSAWTPGGCASRARVGTA